jgi:hypothetical protein
MKLASLRDGTPEGRLVVVSRDVTLCSDARHVAPTLRAALDDWAAAAPALDLIARGVESGGQPVQRFHEREALAPLPGGADPRGPTDAARVTPGVSVIAGADGAPLLVVLRCDLGDGRSAFSPVALTPDEIGPVWEGGSIDAALTLTRGSDVTSVRLAPVTEPSAGPLRPVATAAACDGPAPGAPLRIELRDPAGHCPFGAIELTAS